MYNNQCQDDKSEKLHVLPLYHLVEPPEGSIPGVEVRPADSSDLPGGVALVLWVMDKYLLSAPRRSCMPPLPYLNHAGRCQLEYLWCSTNTR